MPIYEYYCQDCNTKFELIRDIAKANDPAKCQKCGSNNTKRLISKFYKIVAISGKPQRHDVTWSA